MTLTEWESISFRIYQVSHLDDTKNYIPYHLAKRTSSSIKSWKIQNNFRVMWNASSTLSLSWVAKCIIEKHYFHANIITFTWKHIPRKNTSWSPRFAFRNMLINFSQKNCYITFNCFSDVFPISFSSHILHIN